MKRRRLINSNIPKLYIYYFICKKNINIKEPERNTFILPNYIRQYVIELLVALLKTFTMCDWLLSWMQPSIRILFGMRTYSKQQCRFFINSRTMTKQWGKKKAMHSSLWKVAGPWLNKTISNMKICIILWGSPSHSKTFNE